MDGIDPFNGDEDAALRHAIALSLREAGRTPTHDTTTTKSGPTEPIAISSDEEDDDDLEQGPRFPSIPEIKSRQSGEKLLAPTVPIADMPKGLGGLDRKQMEEERLARLGKRKTPDTGQTSDVPAQKLKFDHQSTCARPHVTAAPPDTLPSASASSSLQFPKGAVKKTWASRYPRDKDDIKIEEVFRKDELELAVLSSFQWDEEWLLSKIDAHKTNMLLVAFAKDEAQRREMSENVPSGRIRFCFPPMMPFGSMHSKLQLLKYSKSLRIVVPSGNLVPYDWGETGVMENILFIIDLPYLEDPVLRSNNSLPPFGEDLSCFLQAQGLEQGLVNSLKNYDFSEAKRYGFIHSIGQPITDGRWQRTGYCGLGRAVTNLGLSTASGIEIDYVTSSLGTIKEDFLRALYYAAQGDDGLKEHKQRVNTLNTDLSVQTANKMLASRFRIYFPSRNTVESSRGGVLSAGTICARSTWWDAVTFPRGLVRDCESVRPGLLMHNKLIFVRRDNSSSAWAYVGSANLSESAWGRLTVNKKTNQQKMTCRNWECGVLVPANTTESTTQSKKPGLVSTFEGTVPVPMKESTDNYGETHSKNPWFFMEL